MWKFYGIIIINCVAFAQLVAQADCVAALDVIDDLQHLLVSYCS
jgi:hypothetical protein